MTVPRVVLDAYDLDAASLVPITIGLVNRTFRGATRGGARVILQRLHPAFTGAVNEDIDVITRHLAARGLVTPRLVRTRDGAAFVDADDGTYRAITFLDGATHETVASPAVARSAASLVARVHGALEDLEHTFAFTRPGVHDTAKHLARLESVAANGTDDEARAIADAILAHARALPELPATRTRILHGDLKITNVLFTPDGGEALALVDLDTFQHGTLAAELGDALRSWCNPRGESDVDAVIDEPIFEAAVTGYLGRLPIDAEERASLVLGTEAIATELAARFCTDAFEDRYFGYDAARYPSRVAHNRVRARSQLALARSIRARRAPLEAAVARAARAPHA